MRASIAKWLITSLLTATLFGCFIPNAFDLYVEIPDASNVKWKFDGKWQFFFAGYDPGKQQLRPQDIAGLTAELSKLPGGASPIHAGGNVWTQTINWQVSLRDGMSRPSAVNFPTGTAPRGGGEYWLLRVTPESSNSVLVETVSPPTGRDLADFLNLGYKSEGTLSLYTTGTIEQLSGSPLSKSWFGKTYSTKWDFFHNPPVKVRIKW